jgi:predicted metal-dependent phosphoesterase TrpH
MLRRNMRIRNLMGKADIHIHTVFSDGLMTPEALVEFAIARTDLNVIAVTDHDTISGGLVARAYAQYFQKQFRPFEVIVGSEITSAEGEILALFIEKDIPPGLSAAETVARIHEQGGLAIAAHPFAHSSKILPIDGMTGAGRLIATVAFDGIEARNGTPSEWVSNRWTQYQNRRLANRPETGGSDTHYLPTVGSSYTCFAGTTAEDLRASILAGTISAGGHVYNPLHIFGLAYEVLMKRLPVRTLPAERSRAWPLSAAYERTTDTGAEAPVLPLRVESKTTEPDKSDRSPSNEFISFEHEPYKTAVH